MSTDALCDAPLTEVVASLGRRAVSARELVDAYLDRIERQAGLKAFITVTASHARRQAAAADRRLVRRDSAPLLGAPLAIKDLFMTRGVRTTGGSRILRDFIPRRDAAAVSRLRNAGAITLGKLNLHEFAYGVTNGNPFFGIARNPHDPSRIPGGSSGGSAIAVVAGLCAASIGSDTGGSIRIPAALCGCVGLKPTYGAVPLDGVIPLGWSLDHAGPIARTVSDAALLYAVLTGQPSKPVRRPRGLRIGVLSDRLLRPVERGVAAATERALERLQGAGARLREVALPELSMSVAAQLATLRAEASALHRTWLRSRPRDYGRDVRLRLQLGALAPASDYVLAQRARERLRAGLRRAFEQVDVLALPTTPVTAPLVGERKAPWPSEPVDGALVRLTSPFNLTGAPALSLPCGLAGRLPVGLQLVAPWGAEDLLLGAGRLLEDASK